MTPENRPGYHRPIPTHGAIFKLAWPLAVNAILLQGIVILDTYLVSILGENALTAMGLAGAIAGLLSGALMSISHATQILVARAKGADDPVALKSALWCAVAIGGAVAGLGLALVRTLGDDVIGSFAHTPEIAQDAVAYLDIFALVIVFEVGSQAISCHFNGTGRTRLPFYSHLAEMPVNIGLSVVLIFGLYGFPELGLKGAAIGSAAAALVRLLFLAVCLHRLEAAVIRAPGWARATFPASVTWHALFALPVAAAFFGQAACNTVSALLYARMSVNDFAAMTLILPWIQVVGTMMISWAQATGIFVGQLLGQRETAGHMNAFLKRSWRVCIVIAAFVSTLYLAASMSFRWIYEDLQRETLDALWSFVPALLLLSFPKSSNAMCGSTLRAGGDTVYVMNIHLFSQWAYRVPMTALLVLYLDWSVTWVFALLLFEECLKFPFFHLRVLSGKWRTMLDRRT
ncbi:MAG: MATE family efflux transporter [Pseudomonadota bacterium]